MYRHENHQQNRPINSTNAQLEEEGNKQQDMGQLQDPFSGRIPITHPHTHNGRSRASQFGQIFLFDKAITMMYMMGSAFGNIVAETAADRSYLASLAVS